MAITHKEIWKDIKGYEEFYSVSNSGKIFSKRQNKVMKVGNNGNGYLYIGFKKR